MKYNVGDKVRIKSIDWYNENKNENGSIYLNNNSFVSDMSEFCGKIATIIKKCDKYDKYYKLDIDKNKGSWSWTDDMLEDIMESKKVKITLPKDCKVSDINTTVKDNCIVVEYIPEKKKEFIPKDGDIIFTETCTCVCKWVSIFKEEIDRHIQTYCDISIPDDSYASTFEGTLCAKDDVKEMRVATENEKQILFDFLKSKGLKWNKEEKKVEKLRWRAKEGESYYYITDNGVICGIDDEFNIDNNRYASGNYFKTVSEAEKYAEKIKKLLIERN